MHRLVAILLTLCLLAPGLAAAQDRLSGTYMGVKDAEGARLDIQPAEDGFSGTLYDARGNAQGFRADRVGETAEAIIDMGGGAVLMQVSPMPYGAEVAFVPVEPNGALNAARARVDNFVRPGLEVPDPPAGFLPPPVTPNTRITGNTFLQSYQFWSPSGVSNGYSALPDRVRTLMRFFPAVQLDVIFKLCLAPQGGQALAEALRGQGVACPQVVQAMADAQRRGTFDSYKEGVEAELAQLLASIRCAEGYLEGRATCDQAARTLSDAAVSLRTAAHVLQGMR